MILLWLMGCGPMLCQANGTGLGTTWSAQYMAPACVSIDGDVKALVTGIEAELGIWSETSEIHKIRESTAPVMVSESTYGLVREALDVAAASGGAFDPTIEPLSRAWGLHSEPRTPDDDTLAAAVAQVGWGHVEHGREDSGAPWIDGNGRALDLTGLLEGYTADRVATLLSRKNLGSHLVSVGDELRAAGDGPTGPWRVGIDVEPGEPGDDLVLKLSGGGLASAGGGPDTLDPRTGRRAATDVLRAVVVAPTAAEADALATAWVVLGSKAGLALIEARPDAEGVAYVDGGTVRSGGF